MQIWRGKGSARTEKLRLIAVEGEQVVFERCATARTYIRLGIPARCTVEQLRVAFEFEREATEEDLAAGRALWRGVAP